MKAISLWQPWASLLACGAKKYETHSWATKYRGPIAIHAAKRPPKLGIYTFDDNDSLHALLTALRNANFVTADMPLGMLAGYVTKDGVLPTGCVVATAELVGCHQVYTQNHRFVRIGANLDKVDGNELYFGDFTPGRFAWEFSNMRMLPEPIPVTGGQQLWEWKSSP